MLPASWSPKRAGGLVRVGPAFDGGYVTSKLALAETKLLISMGLNDDWRFEKAFQEAAGSRVICFDGSVDARFWALYVMKKFMRLRPFGALHYISYRRFFGSDLAEHRQLMVGYDGPGCVSLDTILAEGFGPGIFLKIDIEGSEYRILEQIVANRAHLTGLVIELHNIDIHRDRVTAFLAAMSDFDVISVAANNFGGTDPAGDPIVIEVSLVRRDLTSSEAPAAAGPLTAPNNPRLANIPICFGGY